MRSKRVWIIVAAVVAVLVAGLLAWRPWREAPAPAPAASAPAAGGQAAARTGPYEGQRAAAESTAKNALDAEAIAVLAETDRAIARIAAGDRAGALSSLEAAAGKAKILVGRNAANALIPAAAEVQVIDTAPEDDGRIGRMRRSLQLAVTPKTFRAPVSSWTACAAKSGSGLTTSRSEPIPTPWRRRPPCSTSRRINRLRRSSTGRAPPW